MPIITLQRSLRRLGRIRMGQQVPTNNGKMRPAKLETWRLTSPVPDLLDAAAEVYGGEVKEWSNPASKDRFELLTTTDTLDIVIPPGDMAFSQWFEMWSGGGCQRRCDGATEQLSGDGCLCPADPDQRREQATKGQACKPTTRLFVVLPRLPDIGMWHLETHGFYAATELAGSVELINRIASAGGGLIPAVLRIDQRSVKRDGKTISYGVPVIEMRSLTAGTLMTGEVPAVPELMAASEDGDVPLSPARRRDIQQGAEADAQQRLEHEAAGRPPMPPLPTDPVPPKWVASIRRKAEELDLDDEALGAVVAEGANDAKVRRPEDVMIAKARDVAQVLRKVEERKAELEAYEEGGEMRYRVVVTKRPKPGEEPFE